MDISQVFTYQDAIEHLIQYNGGATDDSLLGRMKTAVQLAYNELCQSMEWTYFHRPLRINLSAPYSTGTVEVTSGTATLTGGTWPSWAGSGRILIGDVIYQARRRISNTVLDLDDNFQPASAIAAGTSYTLYRSVYLLPNDFRKVKEFIGEDVWTANYMVPDEWLRRERYSHDTGTPWLWTIMQTTDEFGYGRLGVFFSGYPDIAETFDCIYVGFPRPIKYTGYETAARAGTVSCSASTSVTGVGSGFAAGMVGSVIRFTSGTAAPGGIHSFTPYDEQRVIATVTNATNLVLDEATTGTYTTKKYTISDPLDFPPHMRTAFLRGCEKQLDQLLPNPDRYRMSYSGYREALIEARERNQYSPVPAIDSRAIGQRFNETLGTDRP